MKRTLQILTVIITGIVFMYGCDSGGSTELNPTITDIQPESGPPGTEVTITGNSFSPNPAENNVTFGGTTAPVNNASETQIETEVPEGIESGPVQLEVTVDDNTAMGPDFTVMEVLKNQIVFVSDRDGDNEIFVMNADGSNPRQLTNNTTTELLPTISNDGTRIAFVSDQDGMEYDLYVMNADGSNVKRITTSDDRTFYPSWSQDDSKIVFSERRDGSFDLFAVNSDGSSLTQITDGSGNDTYPDWSPEGDKIVFSSLREAVFNLYTINPDGTGLRQLTDNFVRDDAPEWSPDGSEIAFQSYENRNTGDIEIFTINSDATGLSQITDHSSDSEYPTWSPDGQMIAFYRLRTDAGMDVFKINANGSGGLINLTVNSSRDFIPHWSPVE